MWRTQAILDMLFKELGDLRDGDPASVTRARRRGLAIVGLDWLAIIVLVLLHDDSSAQLTLAESEQTLFTIGILAVAVHSGYRLAQVHKLRALERLAAELQERRGE